MAKESDVSFAKESTDVSFVEGVGGRDAFENLRPCTSSAIHTS